MHSIILGLNIDNLVLKLGQIITSNVGFGQRLVNRYQIKLLSDEDNLYGWY